MLKEVVIDGINGIVVSPSDSQSLASAIISLIENRVLLEKLSGSARETALADFSIESFEKKLDICFNGI